MANWPSYKIMKVNIPLQLESDFSHFKTFYEQKYQKRQLSICFSLGQATVKLKLSSKPKPHELIVSTLCMFILLLLND